LRFVGDHDQNRRSLLNVAREAMRWPGASDCMVAALVTATLIDFGLVTSEDMSQIVDRQKVRREKAKCRTHYQETELESLDTEKAEGLYFDGKEVETLTIEKTNGISRQKWVKQEHVVLGEYHT
jgi:hypothetical protein